MVTIILNETNTPDLKFNDVKRLSLISFPGYTKETFYHRKLMQGGYFLKIPYQDIRYPLDCNPAISDNLVQIILPRDVVMETWKKMAYKIDLDLDICVNLNPSDKTLGEICRGLNKRYTI